MNCNERPPPLWAQVLLAIAPVIAGAVGEIVKEHLAHRREQLAPTKPSVRPS